MDVPYIVNPDHGRLGVPVFEETEDAILDSPVADVLHAFSQVVTEERRCGCSFQHHLGPLAEIVDEARPRDCLGVAVLFRGGFAECLIRFFGNLNSPFLVFR